MLLTLTSTFFTIYCHETVFFFPYNNFEDGLEYVPASPLGRVLLSSFKIESSELFFNDDEMIVVVEQEPYAGYPVYSSSANLLTLKFPLKVVFGLNINFMQKSDYLGDF